MYKIHKDVFNIVYIFDDFNLQEVPSTQIHNYYSNSVSYI